MRIKLLSALLLASTAIAGIASAAPIGRAHREDIHNRPSWMEIANRNQLEQRHDNDRDNDRFERFRREHEQEGHGLRRHRDEQRFERHHKR